MLSITNVSTGETKIITPHVMSDNLPKGAVVRATGLFGCGPREATVYDGKKGVIRCLKIHETNDHFGDIGDTYIDEITHVMHPTEKEHVVNPMTGLTHAVPKWLPFVLTDAHARQLKKIRGQMRAMGW